MRGVLDLSSMPLVRYAFALLLFAAAPGSAQIASNAEVRVRILGQESPSEVQISALSGSATVLVDGRAEQTLAPGETVTVARRNGTVQLSGTAGTRTGQTIVVDGVSFRLRSGRIDRSYHGALAASVARGALQLVNRVPMEPYVASVVASELGFDVPEACKAQAVLARTYAARRLNPSRDYDLDDHVGSQVYRGEGVVTASSRAAAESTAGQVLTYRGQLADAYYYSSSGGHTADNDAVWNGAPIPYLRAVADPYDQGSPFYRWESTPSRSEVLSVLSNRFGGRVTGVQVAARSRSGRVRTLRLDGGARAEITGNQFRAALNQAFGWRTVKSTKFDLSVDGDRYRITGSGFGHGVGMSQYGAMGQARQGRTYRQILSFYFEGTDVTGGSVEPIYVAHTEPAPRVSGSTTARTYPTPRRIVREQAAESTHDRVAATTLTRRTAW